MRWENSKFIYLCRIFLHWLMISLVKDSILGNWIQFGWTFQTACPLGFSWILGWLRVDGSDWTFPISDFRKYACTFSSVLFHIKGVLRNIFNVVISFDRNMFLLLDAFYYAVQVEIFLMFFSCFMANEAMSWWLILWFWDESI